MATPHIDEPLYKMIIESVSLDTAQKRLLTNILPMLNQEEKDELSAFLTKEIQEFETLDHKFLEKKRPIYQKYLSQLDRAVQKAKMIVRRENEKVDRQGETKNMDSLLTEL